MAKVAFCIDYEKYGKSEAPSILPFVQLLRDRGNEVDFFISEKELLENMGKKYDCIAISVLSSAELKNALKTALKAKKKDANAVIVLGGHGVQGNAEMLAKAEGVDIVIEGEGEITFPDLLKDIKRAGDSENLVHFDKNAKIEISQRERELLGEEALELLLGDRVSYRKNATVYYASPPTSEELNESINYPWGEVRRRGWKGIALYAQRGCNWSTCSYCGIKTKPGRRLSVENVLKILKEAGKNGIRTVTFDDDQFVQNKRWVSELCDGIIKNGLNKISFGAMIRVDAIDDFALLDKMRKANFGRLQIGVESFVPEKILYFNKIKKGNEEEYVKMAEELIYACLERDIVPGVFIITTRPKKDRPLSEVADELLVISRIIKKASEKYELMPVFSFNDVLMAYPGAPLLERGEYKKMLAPLRALERNGRIVIETLEIPYAFNFKSMALTNFLGNLKAISERRGVPPEVVNETLEHIEDLIAALRISAEHLDSDVGVALEFVQNLDRFDKEEIDNFVERLNRSLEGTNEIEKLIAYRVLSPESIKDAADGEMAKLLDELKKTQSAEKESLLEKCREIEENIFSVEAEMYKKVKDHLSKTRRKLRDAESRGEDELKRVIEEVRKETKECIDLVNPYLSGKNSLEALLEWIDEFEKR